MRFQNDTASRIEDYALIGDCETAALVSRNGSIDWLCWPRFDSGACFAALLGDRFNGRFLLRPIDEDAEPSRRYRDGSLVLETCWRTKSGVALVIDFMPLRNGASDVIRIVRCLEGSVDFYAEYILRFDYGRVTPWINRMDDGALRAVGGPDCVTLHTDAPMRPRGRTHAAEFCVRAGDEVSFHLAWTPSHSPHAAPSDYERALENTDAWWKSWSARCASAGPYSDLVKRSLITLKALTFAPTGGIVAAPTTSLPEEIGGERNWDYRYCWLRDATFTLLALMDAGYLKRRKPGATGCFARSPAIRRNCRSCTASAASAGSPRRRSTGCRASSARRPCGSATARRTSCSSTCSARCSTVFIRGAAAAS